MDSLSSCRRKLDIWFSRSNVYWHNQNIYTFASLCDWRSCKSNFSHTEVGYIIWHNGPFSFDSHSVCSWKPESRQTLHNSFLYKPREIHLSSETVFHWCGKAESVNQGFLFLDFMSNKTMHATEFGSVNRTTCTGQTKQSVGLFQI